MTDADIEKEREAIRATWREQVSTILAGPGAGVVDALVEWAFGVAKRNKFLGLDRGYELGREETQKKLSGALEKARANGAMRLGDVARDIAVATRGNADEPVLEHVSGILAQVMQIQRDTDRSIVIAEATRRARVAEQYPDLEDAARASAKALQVATNLIDAGLLPDDIAAMVATMQVMRRSASEGGSGDEARQSPKGSTTDRRRARGAPRSWSDGKRRALEFLLEAMRATRKPTGTLFGDPRVEVREANGRPMVVRLDGDAEHYLEPQHAEALALALLAAAYDAETASGGAKGGR